MGTCPDTDIDPNFITVNIHNILETTLEELKCVADIRVTFEVQFLVSKLLTVVGFEIRRTSSKKKHMWHSMPTSHTCSNTLDLPRGNAVLPLPSDNELFELDDLAFKNNYFGVM